MTIAESEAAKAAIREAGGKFDKPQVAGTIFTCPACQEAKPVSESAGTIKLPTDWGTITRQVCKDCVK